MRMLHRIKLARKKLHEIPDIKTFFHVLPQPLLEKIAFYLLCVLVLSPLIRLLISPLFINPTTMSFTPNTLYLGNLWHTLLLQIGYLSLIVGLLYVIKLRVTKTPFNFKTQLPFMALIAFMLWSMVAVFFSTNIGLSISGTSYRKEGLITFGAYLGFISGASLIKERAHLIRLAWIFIGAASVLAVLAVLDFTILNQAFTLRQRTSVFHNANHYGYYLLMVILVTTTLFIHVKQLKSYQSFTLMLIFALNLLVLLINTSVGPFLGVLVGLTCLTIGMRILIQGTLKHLLIIWALFLGVSLSHNIFTNHIAQEAKGLSQDVQSVITGDEHAPRAGSGRWRLWTLSLTYGIDAPLTGQGPDNLGSLYAGDGARNDRPHNEFLQHFASLGIIGFVLYTVTLLSYGVTFVLNLKKTTLLDTAFLAIISGYVVSSLFGNTMYYTTPFYLVLLSLGIIHLNASIKKAVNIQS